MIENAPVQRQWWCFSCHTWTDHEAAVPPRSACWVTFSAQHLGPESLPTLPCSGPEILSLLWKPIKTKKSFKYYSLSSHTDEKRVKDKKALPPGRGLRIKSTTSFQSFFRIALRQETRNKKANKMMLLYFKPSYQCLSKHFTCQLVVWAQRWCRSAAFHSNWWSPSAWGTS